MIKKNQLCIFIAFYHCVALTNSSLFHRYLWANYNQFSGQLTQAHNWYHSLFSSSVSSYGYKGYLSLLFESRQYNAIVELIPSLDKEFEKDPDVQLIFALSLEKCNKINAADERLINLTKYFKTNPEITLRTTQAYIRRKEPENALLTLDAFLNNVPRRPNNFIFYFLKSQIHLQLGQLSDALNTISVCLDIHPLFDKGWLLFATLQEQKGEIQKALQGYTTFLELAGTNDSIEKHLFSLMLKHKTNLTCTQFHRSYFEQASSLFNKRQYHAALRCLNQYLELQPDHYEALVLKIQLLAHLGEYKKIIDIASQKYTEHTMPNQVWPKNIYLLHHHGIDTKYIISMLQNLADKHSDNYWSFLYAADLCIQYKEYAQATSLLNKALLTSTDNKLNATIYHQLGLLCYETNDNENIRTYLEKGYALHEHNDHLNNTLSYYWATDGKDIQKAQSFFDKISNAKHTNPHFLDTQALILYKQKEYMQSQSILEKIAHHQHATILLHLAKVHYKLNNTDKALALSKEIALYTINDREKKHLQKLQTLLTR